MTTRIDHHLPAEFLDVPVRWPDGGDLMGEVMANALLASPVAARQYIDGLKVALDHAASADELVHELYRAGAQFGQHSGGSEAGGLLWSTAGALADSLLEEVAR